MNINTLCSDISHAAGDLELMGCLAKIHTDFPEEGYSLLILKDKFLSFSKSSMPVEDRLRALVRAGVELTTQDAPKWEFIAARLENYRFQKRLGATMKRLGIRDFHEKLRYLTDQGLYGSYIMEAYSEAEIRQAEGMLKPGRDELFTYSGLDLLLKRYVIQTGQHEPVETPQEMFMGIALHLAMKEKNGRMYWVQKFYDMLSRLEVTMATPTLSNARKPFHQLSSCFIDTVPDSLEGIYRSVANFSQVSKFGGGMGLYFGKVRASGSAIRGFEGAAGGVIRWIKLVNDTAVAVDQLGMRQGAAAVYLDAWHKDLPEFLQLRTNNGDERLKAHDIFPAICYPDLFWKMARENLDQAWTLLCPHEVLTKKGYALEDYYGDEWEIRYKDCIHDPQLSKRHILLKDLVRMILKSAVETGTPFVFNRDTVNRANPNPHAGMIYCSNLCTEIAQNMSGIESVSTRICHSNSDSSVTAGTGSNDAMAAASDSAAAAPVGMCSDGTATAPVGMCSDGATTVPIGMCSDGAATGKVATADGDIVVVTITRPGDFVVCNLASLSLGHLPVDDKAYLFDVVATAVRALDNVIDLNFYPLPYAQITNQRYRGIGLGVSGYHHMLAKKHIRWESEEHQDFADRLFEQINYAAISASTRLAAEKGSYRLYKGSDWQTGAYFTKRGYMSEDWKRLAATVAANGMRNAYLLAVAPTSSTSILSGTTAGLDPVMKRYFLEEKKGSMLPRVAPELSPDTFWYYKNAHQIDQTWSIKACGRRQKHIDQAQSMNLYITNESTLRQVLNLYLLAWEEGVKTIYYVRSKSLEIEECESCSS